MYFFDPQLGRRRRALVRDQFDHFAHQLPEDFDAAWRDLTNRAYGSVAEIGSCLTAHDESDDVICQRVRTKAGRYLRHPSALEVDVSEGCVTLRGPVLADEAQSLIQAVRWVPGVCSVENQLDVHETPGSVSALQGPGQIQGEPFELMQANWSPGVRLACGTLGGALLANCLVNRGASSLLGGLVGFALLARSIAQPQQAGQLFRTSGQQSHDGGQSAPPSPSRETRQAPDLGPNAPVHGPPWPPSITQPQHPAAEEADRFPPLM
jgi:hypothetical protein